jgi:N-acetylglucosaminyl-diphospho-decaprenol L-rhamnosyltransferase
MLSILIVTFNSASVIAGCLDSLRANPPSAEFEVLVADNGSADGTTELVRAGYSSVRLVETGSNLGFAGGNSAAAAQSTGDLLLLLNPDTIVPSGALDELVSALCAEESRWVAGACLVTRDGGPSTSWGDFPSVGWAMIELAPWRRLGFPIRSKRAVGGTCEAVVEVRDVDWVSGAAFLVRRDAWDRLGGLDDGYFMYFEETDFCARAHKAGGRIVLVPTARIVHLEGASVGQASLRQRVWFYRSLLRFLSKHSGPLASAVVRLWVLAVNGVLFAGSLVVGFFSASTRTERPRYAALVRVSLGLPVPTVDERVG